MMLPMNVRCTTCGEFMYRATKFNSIKEDIEDDNYLGIRLFRFFFKCTGCNTYFSIRTDPQNSDYVVEKGASRNFEPWKQQNALIKRIKEEREEEEEGNKMKQLENKTEDSKREMDIIDALAEMKDRSSMIDSVSIDDFLSHRFPKLQQSPHHQTKSQIQKSFAAATLKRQQDGHNKMAMRWDKDGHNKMEKNKDDDNKMAMRWDKDGHNKMKKNKDGDALNFIVIKKRKSKRSKIKKSKMAMSRNKDEMGVSRSKDGMEMIAEYSTSSDS